MDPQKPLQENESFEPQLHPSAPEVTTKPEEHAPKTQEREVIKDANVPETKEQPHEPEKVISLEDSVQRVSAPVTPPLVKDRLHREIESVLEEDLEEIYKALPSDKQKQFHDEGEKTAASIRALLVHHTKKHARKILNLIKRWLRLIPGVNRFFLEQEAKIKTDKIVLVAEEEERRKEQKIT